MIPSSLHVRTTVKFSSPARLGHLRSTYSIQLFLFHPQSFLRIIEPGELCSFHRFVFVTCNSTDKRKGWALGCWGAARGKPRAAPFTHQLADLHPMPRLPSPRVPQMCMGIIRVTVWQFQRSTSTSRPSRTTTIRRRWWRC